MVVEGTKQLGLKFELQISNYVDQIYLEKVFEDGQMPLVVSVFCI